MYLRLSQLSASQIGSDGLCWRSMNLISVSSSVIRAIGYDGYVLAVVFHNGQRYDHPGVPHSVFTGLMQAASKGAYYNQHIRGRYR